MLRGIFMAPKVSQEHVAYYQGLFAKVFETQEWKDLMERGAFNLSRLKGKEYEAWVAKEEARHVSLMKAAGFIAK
jgi:tripartite-type tricarboxylate transporter receptor subunit TctC